MAERPRPLKTVDLNFDGGEGFDDAALMPHVSTVHVACGGHAGDEASMTNVVRLALDAGVAVGAHPSFPDRANFGRKAMKIAHDELAREIRRQVESLVRVVERSEARLVSVKPHGALYHEVARDPMMARLFAETIARLLPGTTLVTFPKSALHEAGRAAGCEVRGEAFVDRRYTPEGGLVSRTEPDALLKSPDEAVKQALSIVQEGAVTAKGGERIPVVAETLCVHSDTPGAGSIAAAVRRALETAGLVVVASAS